MTEHEYPYHSVQGGWEWICRGSVFRDVSRGGSAESSSCSLQGSAFFSSQSLHSSSVPTLTDSCLVCLLHSFGGEMTACSPLSPENLRRSQAGLSGLHGLSSVSTVFQDNADSSELEAVLRGFCSEVAEVLNQTKVASSTSKLPRGKPSAPRRWPDGRVYQQGVSVRWGCRTRQARRAAALAYLLLQEALCARVCFDRLRRMGVILTGSSLVSAVRST